MAVPLGLFITSLIGSLFMIHKREKERERRKREKKKKTLTGYSYMVNFNVYKLLVEFTRVILLYPFVD